MKLVSTSNIELERAESLQRSKKPSLAKEDDEKASEFSRSMLQLSPVASNSCKQDFLLLQKSECNSDPEPLAPDVEALAAAPVNDTKLFEGFELFGSVFSLLQLKQSSETDNQLKPTSVLNFNEKSMSRKTLREGTVASIVEPGGADPVVIGFEKANKRYSILANLGAKQAVDSSSAVKQPENATLSELGLHANLKLRDQPDPQAAPVIQLRPKEEGHQSAIDASTSDQSTNLSFQNTASVSDTQPLSSMPPRVDQIVRAVLQQSAEVSGSSLLQKEPRLHARLTGQTLRLSLHPVELGSVQISISKRGNRLQVTIVPDLESTGRLLLTDTDQLVKSLGLANNNTDHVQVHIATADGSVDMQSGGDPKQTFTRPENNRNGQDGQYASSHTSEPKQQESQNSDERRNINRKKSSDNQPGGAVYI